jgi:hypothetical protein
MVQPFKALPPIVRSHIVEQQPWRAAEWASLESRPGAAQGGNRVHRQPTPVVDNSRERREARRTAARKAKEARLSRIKQLAELIVGNQRTRFFDRWKRNVRRKKVPPCPNIGTPNSPIRAREVDVRELKSSASPNTHTLPCPACPHATRADLLL